MPVLEAIGSGSVLAAASVTADFAGTAVGAVTSSRQAVSSRAAAIAARVFDMARILSWSVTSNGERSGKNRTTRDSIGRAPFRAGGRGRIIFRMTQDLTPQVLALSGGTSP